MRTSRLVSISTTLFLAVGGMAGAANAHAASSSTTAVTWTEIPEALGSGSLSRGGDFVLTSTRSRLSSGDTNDKDDVYRYQRSTRTWKLVSATSAGVAVGVPFASNGDYSARRVVTDDGRFAFFETASAVIPAVPAGNSHIYRKDLTTGAVAMVDIKSSGAPAVAGAYEMGGATNSGTQFVFSTPEKLVASDTNTYSDAYVWNSGTGRATIIPGTTSHHGVRISGDGLWVVYGALNSGWDTVRRNLSTGTVNTISTGTQLFDFAITNDGSGVAFTTTKNLVAADTQGADAYYWKAGVAGFRWLTKGPAPTGSGDSYTFGNINDARTTIPISTTKALLGSEPTSAYMVSLTGLAPTLLSPGAGSVSNGTVDQSGPGTIKLYGELSDLYLGTS